MNRYRIRPEQDPDLGSRDTRKPWQDYMRAYGEAIAETTTDSAPWFVVPADRKWLRNIVVSQIVIDALESMDLRYPEPETDLSAITIH